MPDTNDDVDLAAILPQRGRTPELEPYVPARQHDWVRTVVTVGLLGAFGGTIFWACRQSTSAAAQWSQTKEMLQIILPAITGLLGSVIGFYFGSGANLGGRKDS